MRMLGLGDVLDLGSIEEQISVKLLDNLVSVG